MSSLSPHHAVLTLHLCMSQCNTWHFPELNSFPPWQVESRKRVFWSLKPGAWLPPCVGSGCWQAPFPLISAAPRSLFCILHSRSVRNETKDTQTVRFRLGEVSCVYLSIGSNNVLFTLSDSHGPEQRSPGCDLRRQWRCQRWGRGDCQAQWLQSRTHIFKNDHINMAIAIQNLISYLPLLPCLTMRWPAPRDRLPSPSRRVGWCWECRAADGLGQQERGGQRPHRKHAPGAEMGEWLLRIQRGTRSRLGFWRSRWTHRCREKQTNSSNDMQRGLFQCVRTKRNAKTQRDKPAVAQVIC